MKSSSPPRTIPPQGAVVVGLYSLTLLLSAGLLFWVQPFFGKLLLPQIGGAPAVWNTAMLFFQAALLGGYAYAHFSSHVLAPNRQAVVHFLLLLLCLLWLPVGLNKITLAQEQDPSIWVLATLAASIGVPFMVLAGSAPILQRWFATTNHPDAANPYFLYAASNLGSIGALLGFPLLAEPLLGLDGQSRVWSASFVALIALTMLCAFIGIKKKTGNIDEQMSDLVIAGEAPSARRKLLWLSLVLLSTSLMLGLTTHLTTDVAAVPLLWVVPLVLYLLTFVIAFARQSRVSPQLLRRIVPFAVMFLAILWIVGPQFSWMLWAVFLCILFFIVTLACHVHLAHLRPHSQWLTHFYLWIAVGGTLGGAFNALAAPLLFDRVIEFPLMMAAAAIVLAVATKRSQKKNERVLLIMSGVTLLGLLALNSLAQNMTENIIIRDRNFYGTLTILDKEDPAVRSMVYGTTIHGQQLLSSKHRIEPLSYYARIDGIGQVFDAVADQVGTDQAEIGAIGLGVGSVFCLTRPGWKTTFYELNPSVVHIAENKNMFSFLSGCSTDKKYKVVIGDGRLSLKAEPDGRYNLLLVDAFTSDSIPMHMLTREAIALFMDKIRPDGLLTIHISNRHLDLAPVVASIAQSLGLSAIIQRGNKKKSVLGLPRIPPHVVVLARKQEQLSPLLTQPDWNRLEARPDEKPWTDDYSNIFGALKIFP